LVLIGRSAAASSLVIAMLAARPLLGSFDQAFQYIQEFTGFFTPGICVIFLLGMFWERATATGALVAAVASALLSFVFKLAWPTLPFMDRVGLVFLLCLALAVGLSMLQAPRTAALRVDLRNVDYSTDTTFKPASVLLLVILIVLYAVFW
jgi:SSS family solute:Na+ symporter